MALPPPRAARPQDWPAIEALLRSHALPLQGAREHLARFRVAESEAGDLVGCAGLEPHGRDALLRSVAVGCGWQRRGLGHALVQALLADAADGGFATLYLLTTGAPRFFEALGFAHCERGEAPASMRASPEFSGACPQAAAAMRRVLQPRWRWATAGDAEAVAAIYAPIVAGTAISFEAEPPSAAEMRRRIEDTLGRLPWLVGLDESGRVEGYAYASAHRERAAYAWSVDTTAYVREDRRGRGTGARLYRALCGELARLGYCQAFAGIALPNEASVGLHESLGFAPIGIYRQVGYKLGRWHDVGWWQKTLQMPAGQPRPPQRFTAG